MSNKNYIKIDKAVDYIYDKINEGRESKLSKELIEKVIRSQGDFLLDKIEEGSFETIKFLKMGKFSPSVSKIQKLNNNGKNN